MGDFQESAAAVVSAELMPQKPIDDPHEHTTLKGGYGFSVAPFFRGCEVKRCRQQECGITQASTVRKNEILGIVWGYGLLWWCVV